MAARPWAVMTQNVALMHLLERIARRFNRAGVPLMVLKGAAFQLRLYEHPGQRPMDDLDLLVLPRDVARAQSLLTELGCRPGAPLVRPDFFPRFYYEIEYIAGDVFPLKVDVHARPFRPLRYAATLPADAFWQHAEPVRIGTAAVRVPAPDEMLIHLATHASVHGLTRPRWLQEIKLWAEHCAERLDWPRLVATAAAWKLTLPVRYALLRVERDYGAFVPATIREQLCTARVGWRDRLALWHAPRDAAHPVGHVAVNALCAADVRFAASYLRAVCWPSRAHMAEWYGREHPGWVACAHAARWLGPAWRGIGSMWQAAIRRRARMGARVGAARQVA